MAAESNTSVDIEVWIEKVINSCETLRHCINAERLVKTYVGRLQEEGMPYYQYIFIRDKFEGMLWDIREQIENKNE